VSLILGDLQNDFPASRGRLWPCRSEPSIHCGAARPLCPWCARPRARVLIVATLFTLVPGRGGEADHFAASEVAAAVSQKGDFAPGGLGTAACRCPRTMPTSTWKKIAYIRVSRLAAEWVLRKCGVRAALLHRHRHQWRVASTVRDAHVREFDCTVIEDGCAAFSDEVHRAAIEGLKPVTKITNQLPEMLQATGRLNQLEQPALG
jgi:hypothetical protein